MCYVTEEENFKYTQNFANMLQNHNRLPVHRMSMLNQPPLLKNSQTVPHKVQQPFFNRPPNVGARQIHTNPHGFNTFQTPFPSQPLTLKHRPVQQRFPTNAQVFGTPKNVFKPSGQRPQNLPEPMSTTSRNTFMRRPQSSVQPMSTRSICPQFNNYSYQPHNSQNFISEELNFTHNVDQQTEQLNFPCLQQQNTDYDYECLQNEQTFTVYHAAQILTVT